jgi:hypothetical protein
MSRCFIPISLLGAWPNATRGQPSSTRKRTAGTGRYAPESGPASVGSCSDTDVPDVEKSLLPTRCALDRSTWANSGVRCLVSLYTCGPASPLSLANSHTCGQHGGPLNCYWPPSSFLRDSCLSCTEPVPCRTHLTSILRHGIPWAKGAAAPFLSRNPGTRHSENMR